MNKREWDPTRYQDEFMAEKTATALKLGKGIASVLRWDRNILPHTLGTSLFESDDVTQGLMNEEEQAEIANFGFRVLAPFALTDKRASGMMNTLIRNFYGSKHPMLLHALRIQPLGRTGMCEITAVVSSFEALADLPDFIEMLPSGLGTDHPAAVTKARNSRG
jgi:hypothetical protein